MTMFYSPNTGGFYEDSFKPSDAIELRDEEYKSLVANQRGNGFTVKDGVVVVAEPLEPPVKTPEQVRAELESKRDVLLGVAGLRISPLQDSVDLGKATESDLVALNVWKQYRVDVNRVDLSHEPVIWPPLPE